MGVPDHGECAKLRPSVTLTGTAKEGSSGPPIGLVDIGVGQSAYLFRVALPGVKDDQSKVHILIKEVIGKLKCDIQRNGKVHIQGIISDEVGLLKGLGSIYQVRVQQICPPGPFSVSFNLPGPVDPRLVLPTFRSDGILEVVVMRYSGPNIEEAQGRIPASGESL